MSELDVVMHLEQILVAPDAQPKETAGGLHIPDTVELEIDTMRAGTCVAAGPGLRGPEGKPLGCSVKVGDRVVFNKRVGAPIVVNDIALLVMADRDIKMSIGPGVTLSKIMARVPA